MKAWISGELISLTFMRLSIRWKVQEKCFACSTPEDCSGSPAKWSVSYVQWRCSVPELLIEVLHRQVVTCALPCSVRTERVRAGTVQRAFRSKTLKLFWTIRIALHCSVQWFLWLDSLSRQQARGTQSVYDLARVWRVVQFLCGVRKSSKRNKHKLVRLRTCWVENYDRSVE